MIDGCVRFIRGFEGVRFDETCETKASETCLVAQRRCLAVWASNTHASQGIMLLSHASLRLTSAGLGSFRPNILIVAVVLKLNALAKSTFRPTCVIFLSLITSPAFLMGSPRPGIRRSAVTVYVLF